MIFAVTGNIKPLLPTELIFYRGNLDNKNRKLYIIHVIICVTLVSPVEKNKIEKWNGEWRCVCETLSKVGLWEKETFKQRLDIWGRLVCSSLEHKH